jgi:hypothetical protein
MSQYYWQHYKTDQERKLTRARIEEAVWAWHLRKEAFRQTPHGESRKLLRELSSIKRVATDFGMSAQTLLTYKGRMILEGRLPEPEPTDK